MNRILTSILCVCAFFTIGVMGQPDGGWFKAGVWEGLGDALAQPLVRKTNAPARTQPVSFTSGNIVVCRIGSGTTTLSSAAFPVFLDEFTADGTYVSTIALPTVTTATDTRFTLSGTNSTDCQITRSADGRYIVAAGYGAAVGTAGVSSVSGYRQIARVDAAGTVRTNTSTTAFSTSQIRSATSVDGSGFWAVGSSGGVFYVPFGVSGGGSNVSTSVTANRFIHIFDGQLYSSGVASGYQVGTVGSGTPTSSSNTMTALPGVTTSNGTGAFFLADLSTDVAGVDTLYLVDTGTGTGPSGSGVKKFSLVGGTWALKGTFPASASPSIPATVYVGLTGIVSSPNTVTLFATQGSAAGNKLVKFVDTTGYNAAPTAIPTLLSTAAANTVYRGVALAPEEAASAPDVITGSSSNLTATSVTLNATANPNGAASTGYFRYGATDPGTCNDSFGTRLPASGGTDLGAGTSSVAFSENIAELSAGTTYYYCAIAQNAGGTSFGSVSSFTTPLPSLSIDDVSLSEGDSGSATFTFTVSLSAPAGSSGVTFDIATADSTAIAGTDYETSSLAGQSIPPGSSSSQFSVSVNGDTGVEPAETFFVNVTNVSGATVADAQGAATIANDDAYTENLVVTNTADTNDGYCNDDCSLRDAVAAANSSPDANTITFAVPNAIAADSIVLSSELQISGDLTISGPGADQMTIDGGGGSNRIFDVAAGTNVTITGLTLTGGGGVGVLNSGSGGAIRAEGALTLEGVHLTSNSVSVSGGGLFLVGAGPYLISNSTISDNHASGSGAGLFKNSAADLMIVNTTFSGNSIDAGNAGAAICTFGAGVTTLRGITIYDNSAPSFAAGIYHADGTLDIGNSIIAGNISSAFPELYIASGTVVSSGFNLVGNSTGDSASTNLAIPYTATDKLDVDPRLAPLGNNGGTVPTHAFDNSGWLSPAIDAGSSFNLTVDARGMSRTVDFAGVANAAGGDGADIGAYELLAPTAARVTITGRVLTAAGRPVSGAVVTLTGESGEVVRAVTNVFGYYRFEGVSGGEGYVLSVTAKRYSFRAVFVNADADVVGLDVYAQ